MNQRYDAYPLKHWGGLCVLMSTLNCEKDSLLGQTVLVKRPFSNFDRGHFFDHPLVLLIINFCKTKSVPSLLGTVTLISFLVSTTFCHSEEGINRNVK